MEILFRQYLPLSTAAAQVGKTVKDHDGKIWHCVGHNDLGVLYFAKSIRPNAKRYCCDFFARQLTPDYGKGR